MAASTLISAAAKKASSLLLGVCVPCLKINASKITVQQLEFDKKLLMFFEKNTTVYAYDPNKICKSGDVVLIEELPQKMSSLITHRVIEIVYPFGDIVDPVTGKHIVGMEYRENLDNQNEILGKVKSSFNYKSAPKRGWQEGKKDFSHRETYLQYHEFEEGDDNKDQPSSTKYV